MNAVLRQHVPYETTDDGEPNAPQELQPATPQQHNRHLLRAAQHGGEVMFNGRRSVMVAIAFQQDGCDVTASVYLQGELHSLDGRNIEVPAAASRSASAGVDAERQSVLLHCLQTAHPVTHCDRYCFVHTLRFDLWTEGLRSTIYISGLPNPVPIDTLSRQPRPPAVLQLLGGSQEAEE